MAKRCVRRTWSDDREALDMFANACAGCISSPGCSTLCDERDLIFKWLNEPRFPVRPARDRRIGVFCRLRFLLRPEAALPSLHQSAQVRASCVRSGRRPAPTIEIVTTDGHRLTVEGDFDGDALARLLKGLVS